MLNAERKQLWSRKIDALRVVNELRKRGLTVPPAGVRCVWQPMTKEKMIAA